MTSPGIRREPLTFTATSGSDSDEGPCGTARVGMFRVEPRVVVADLEYSPSEVKSPSLNSLSPS